MFNKLQRNKWLIAMSASGIHICIGSVYAWSVLVLQIINFTQWSLFSVTITFSIAILFLGLSAGYFGKYVEKYGASKSGLVSTAFFITGILGSALALYLQNVYLLYLFYGIFGGIGLGIGYITPISTLVKYFPNNRGFATGLAIMSFGFASMISAPLMNYLIAQYGLITNFIIMAVFYSIVMIISSLYLDSPEYKENGDSLPPTEVYSTWQFKALWHIFFVNIACGIALLSIISPMAQEIIGFSAMKVGNAIRTIDTWYSKYNVDDCNYILPINPYGQCREGMDAFRLGQEDYFSIQKNIAKGKNCSETEMLFFLAVLMRGGLLGMNDV